MIRAGHWVVAAGVAVALHGVVLGFAMSSDEVMMEASAGRPGMVWGLPVEAVADVVDPASPPAAESAEAERADVADDVEPTEPVAEVVPLEVSEPAEPLPEPVTADTIEAASVGETVPVAEAAPVSAWQGGIAVTAEEVEPIETPEAAAEFDVAALSPAESSTTVPAEDVTAPLPRIRPDDVPRVEAPAKRQAAKTPPKSKAAPSKPKSASGPAAARTSARQGSSAAPAGEQVGSGGRRQADGGRQLVSSYAGRVASHLQRHKRYPKEAAEEHLTGTATITFTIGANGRVRSARLARSSGTGAFDREVVAMVDRAAPFPPIPPAIGKSTMTFTVPVRFQPR